MTAKYFTDLVEQKYFLTNKRGKLLLFYQKKELGVWGAISSLEDNDLILETVSQLCRVEDDNESLAAAKQNTVLIVALPHEYLNVGTKEAYLTLAKVGLENRKRVRTLLNERKEKGFLTFCVKHYRVHDFKDGDTLALWEKGVWRKQNLYRLNKKEN